MKNRLLLIAVTGCLMCSNISKAQVNFPEPCKASFTVAVDSATGYPFLYHFKDNSNGNINAWHWDFGDGATSAEQNPSYQYQSEGSYQICLTVSNTEHPDSCSDQYCRGIITAQYYSLGGMVYAGEYPLNNPLPQGDTGIASLYRVKDNQVIFVEDNIFSEYGYYWFGYVLPGKYFVKIGLTENSTHFKEYFTTYDGDKVNWSQAGVISLESANNYDVPVNLVPVQVPESGTGMIRGFVNFEQGGEYSHPPVTQTTVILADKNKVPLVYTHPDAAGYFQFDGLPFETYFLSADATGKPSTTVMVTLTEGAPVAEGINLTIFGGNVFGIPEEINQSLSITRIYPNPVGETVNLEIFSMHNVPVIVQISGLPGKIIFSKGYDLIKGSNYLQIPVAVLPGGLYLLTVQSVGHASPVAVKFLK